MTPGESEIIAFARRWGFAPDSPALRAALTHRSAAASPAESSERLEFLGDALLSAFVARFLLDALPPDTREGVLSRARTELVRRETLARAISSSGQKCSSLSMPIWISEMLVDSSGSRKPADRPIATQLPIQKRRTWPARKRTRFGSPRTSPSSWPRSVASAWSSLM
jgi:dsRNA-specific ribonuclease